MIIFDITGNLAFDYFYSLNMNLGLIILSFIFILKVLNLKDY
jgi:hypothetical protein